MTKKLTIALFSASMIALSATSSFAQDSYAASGRNVSSRATRPLPQGFREHFAAMPTADGRIDQQIDRARAPAQAAQ
jgi:hypothetical protein